MDIINSISNLTHLDYIEWTAVILNLIFLVLLIKEKKSCWIFGIIASAISIYLFVQFKLYSEAVLYFFYVLIGIYGWHVWNSNENKNDTISVKNGIDSKTNGNSEFEVSAWPWSKHIPIILVGVFLSFALGLFFKTQTDAERTYVDSTTTIFSFIASYMEAHKVFSAWIFWILINGVSIWLYYDRGLVVYSFQMVIFFVVSLFGFWDWGKKSGVWN